MLQREEIESLFVELNDFLAKKDVKGEVCLVGGAYMCVALSARPSTKDIDAIFQPADIVRNAIEYISIKHQLPSDWLNDGVKGFFPKEIDLKDGIEIWSGSNLLVWGPKPEYVLAMKIASSRTETHDIDDLVFLAKLTGLKTADSLIELVHKYYGKKIAQKTFYILRELEESGRLT